ncbi:ribosome-associated ATPase/putative transporter RbbA [Segnochrobactraceae bacterium EtOH-i3]
MSDDGQASARPAVVAATHLGHRFGKTVALDDVAFSVAPGEAVAVIGPDGVGKSTLLSLIAGARKLQKGGSLQVLGANMARAREREAASPRIAFMPQGLGASLYRDLSVGENLLFFARLFGVPKSEREGEIVRLLRATALLPFRDRPAGKLSGGMKQKLGLCCALIHAPDLILLDEPTTGVDPLSRREFWQLVDDFWAEDPDLSLVIATSTLEEAARFDRVAMMNAGRILADAPPAELLARTGTTDLDAAFVAFLPERPAPKEAPAVAPVAVVPVGDGEPVIVAEGLTKTFGAFTAVDHVTVSIRRGEIYGFLGSNGCGKSTTMKMLTGLSEATSGTVMLLGKTPDPRDMETRRRVGYMAQAFSLYGELTVAENLHLHARLFGLSTEEEKARTAELIAGYDLAGEENRLASALPLGVRQRLSLAVAVLHRPEILILDEPTSGVDPVARDLFWDKLIQLSRQEGVTVFLSTHYMGEAARCDRIAFMHAGRILAEGAPEELRKAKGEATLDGAFIAYMSEARAEGAGAPASAVADPPEAAASVADPTAGAGEAAAPAAVSSKVDRAEAIRRRAGRLFSLTRAAAWFGREARELTRDRIRLVVAFLGTAILMVILGFGITTDVDGLRFAVHDRDRSPESMAYADAFGANRTFEERPPAASDDEITRRLQANDIALGVIIPENYGRDLKEGRVPEIMVMIDGGMPFRAETILSYVQAIHEKIIDELVVEPSRVRAKLSLEPRYRYNPEFKSVNAMVPATIALLLLLIPAILTSLAVVREKELGTIANFSTTPTTRLEFLIGKQALYILIAFVNFLLLCAMGVFLFGVPLKGSFLGLALAAFLYVMASTAIGLLVSSFTSSQAAALFVTAIVTMMPATQFSGLLQPVASLVGGARVIGTIFPATYFIKASVGAFTKGLDFRDLLPFIATLAIFWPVLVTIAALLLPKQER